VPFSFRELGLEACELVPALLDARAQALETRARAQGRLASALEPARLRLWLRRDRLEPAALVALEGLPETRLAPALAGELATLDAPRACLAELAGDPRAADLARLLAAHDAATRPRGAPIAMGVLNVTPDSFSDGGRYLDPRAAIERGLALAAAGARLLDVGGESTRPGAAPVPAREELARVLPVVSALASLTDVPVGVDTRKAEVAAACLAAGARLVNDVSAGRAEPELLETVARSGASIVLMHMQGTPRDMQRAPAYTDVVREVTAFLRERAARCLEAGIAPGRIAVDPGIGFGKTVEHNLALLRALPELRSLGLPVVLGASRKSFLGALTGAREAADREPETLAVTALAAALGVDVHRVHEPAAVVRVLALAHALGGGRP
jgi:dihydropteroate synthase